MEIFRIFFTVTSHFIAFGLDTLPGVPWSCAQPLKLYLMFYDLASILYKKIGVDLNQLLF